MSAIARLLRPRSVAVVGASADPAKMTGRPVGYLQRHGFSGEIWPVNPRAQNIAGLPCFADVAALPAAPDVAIVLLAPDRATEAVRALAARGTSAAIVLASGYGEAGPDGARRQLELREAAGAMRLLGPNTIGLVNLTDRIVLSATGALEAADLPSGGVSLVSQSGGILGALLSRGAARGMGFAKLVSTGNEADLDVSDFVEHLVDDPATRVIALYMEGLRRPGAFRAAALRAAGAGKPIVVFKVGRSASGARAAVSHTGALAGADRMYDALFGQLGVIRATTFDDLLDLPAALVQPRRARGRRIAILTSTGGAGALLADAFGLAGFEVPMPDGATTARMAALLGSDPQEPIGNPVDVTLAGVRPDVFKGAIEALLESPEYDALAVVVGSSALAQPAIAAGAIAEGQARSQKPIVAYVSPHAPEIVALLNRQGVIALTAPEACASVLAVLAAPAAAVVAPSEPVAHDPLAALPAGSLNEADSKALFARFGLPVVQEGSAATPDAAQAIAERIGGELVLKILSNAILHKSDVGGVRVGVPAAEIASAARDMLTQVRAATGIEPEGLLVQQRVRGGVELILGLIRDPQLGTGVLLGMGGVASELMGDSVVRLLPIGPADAADMIRTLRGYPLLTGWRGAPACDLAALEQAILSFARMGEAIGSRLMEAEINPLFVLPLGRGVVAADGLAVLS
ncbi:acetate--CoA ligase family protein [Humitalea sp. 24SJ18S-53]|uniref:acetate--CoA ligase family protein n=1 Tax=Humitalea sp. 24SJ18S-53 TaxID=3422307 RepID=UPI003D667C73